MKAEYIKSAYYFKDCPALNFPEIAFIGKSNVGKSSLINTLVERKTLVKTSKTPGKTKTINFFMVEDYLIFVDLPGYGYASISKKERKNFDRMIETYLEQRKQLACIFLLLDIRREPDKNDIQIYNWVVSRGIKHILVFTKTDKLSRNLVNNRINAILPTFNLKHENIILFSSKTKKGVEKTWEIISEIANI